MFKHYQDPGHGWIAVKTGLLIELKIAHKISGFSYLKGNTAYLEEDSDAGTFFRAYEEKFGSKPDVQSVHQEKTPIRNYPSYPEVS